MTFPEVGFKLTKYLLPFMDMWIRIAGTLITILGALLVYQFGLTL